MTSPKGQSWRLTNSLNERRVCAVSDRRPQLRKDQLMGIDHAADLRAASGRALGEIGSVSTHLAELIEDFSNTTSRQAASAGTVADGAGTA
mgnify:CR=1 FL=1